MIYTALALALFTTIGFLMIYVKLPDQVKVFIKKHSLLTDAFALLCIYVLLGGTLTALLAASISGIIISLLLYLSQDNKNINFMKLIFKSSFSKIPFLRKMIIKSKG